MGESRTELLAWLNDLLQLNLTKVEQAGIAAVSCLDSLVLLGLSVRYQQEPVPSTVRS